MVVAGALAMGALAPFACTDADRTLGPGRPLADLEDPSVGPIGEFTIPTPPGNVPGVNPQFTGITLPSGAPIKITVSGSLTFNPNPDYATCAGNPGQQPPWGGTGSLGPAGWSTSPFNYRVVLTNGQGGSPMPFTPLDPGATSVVAYYSGAGGPLWAGRPSAYGFQCGIYPQFTLEGSEVVTAEVLSPAQITPDKTTVVSGDTVNLTLSIPWATNFVVNTGWQWVKDSASSPAPVVVQGCGTATTCSYRVFGDGHAEVHGIVAQGVIPLTAIGPRISVAPAHLALSADSTHVQSGSSVKFTARRVDGHPVAVQSWVWTPGNASPIGPIAVDCAGGDSTCVTTIVNTSPSDSTGVSQTGTMTAWAVLGTASESASVAVTVDKPAPIDTTGCGGSPAIVGAARRAPRPAAIPGVRSLKPQLTCGGGENGMPSMTVTADHDTVNTLYPRIRGEPVNGVTVPERQPDTAFVQILVHQWDGSPAPAGIPVTVRAEWLPATGGHAHYTAPIRFDEMPPMPSGTPEAGMPVAGYFFVSATQKKPTLSLTTDSTGKVTTKLVAGYLGGRARVITSTLMLGFVGGIVVGDVLIDTVEVGYAVPGLVSLQTRMPVDHVYWIGGTDDHPQGANFYVQDSVAARLDTLADSMPKTVDGQQLYLQFNDASLPNGGTFSVKPRSVEGFFEDPYRSDPGHTAHNSGLDQDVGYCYAPSHGDDGGGNAVGSSTCKTADTAWIVDATKLHRIACQEHGVAQAHGTTLSGVFIPTHYHIRFVGSQDNAPGC